jgi:hypothetical protein
MTLLIIYPFFEIINTTYDKKVELLIQHIIKQITSISNNKNHDKIYLSRINCNKILEFSRDSRNKPILLEQNVYNYYDKPCNIITITNIVLNCFINFNLNDYNVSNHDWNEMKYNNIMFSIPINCPYNYVLTYNDKDGGNSFILELIQKQV